LLQVGVKLIVVRGLRNVENRPIDVDTDDLPELLSPIADRSEATSRLPVDARASLIVLVAQLQAMQTTIGSLERRIVARHRSNQAVMRMRMSRNFSLRPICSMLRFGKAISLGYGVIEE
jgi:hypothetical protein